jgi:hypothetical protein
MSISIKTNAAPTVAPSIAADIADTNKSGNNYSGSVEAAIERINKTLSNYAAHKTLTDTDFLSLRVDVALAYQEFRIYRNAMDRFLLPNEGKSKVDKAAGALWFATTFGIKKLPKVVTNKVKGTHANRINGIKKAMRNVQICYAKGIVVEVISGAPFVTAESYRKYMGDEKAARMPITVYPSNDSVTFNALGADETEGTSGGEGKESVSTATITKMAHTLDKAIEEMPAEKITMTQREVLMSLMFRVQTVLELKHDKAALAMFDELKKLADAKKAA